jgi:16S rRNA A1518/A1519 N6-dimethyltransferase RsmA/KsgA/DIM1 with predicted DNA glycosylase/AP lyase activity
MTEETKKLLNLLEVAREQIQDVIDHVRAKDMAEQKAAENYSVQEYLRLLNHPPSGELWPRPQKCGCGMCGCGRADND